MADKQLINALADTGIPHEDAEDMVDRVFSAMRDLLVAGKTVGIPNIGRLRAPSKVAKDATVVVMNQDGTMRTLRTGSNGFTCMPDNPATPGPDPRCMDKNAMDWVHAWVGHQAPTVGKIGFMYMLAGGTDASNTDPYASKPEAGNHWIKTGPHIMVVAD